MAEAPPLVALAATPEVQEFVKEESRNGWPYLRLARGLKMKDLSPPELQSAFDTWMDVKERYEMKSGKH